MATPMTPDELLVQLRKFDVPFRQIDGWRTHGRDDETGLSFGPVNGFMIHHTGDDAADTVDRRLIREGRAGLPGPLAQFGCNDDGIIDLIGWGRANHAGGGDPRVLEAVIAEDYAAYPPKPAQHTGSSGAVDGNDRFYGVETYYSGMAEPTAKAYRSLVRLSAAICDFHGWTAKSVIGHKEWSDWKSDPGKVDMKDFRADVDALLIAVNAPTPPPAPEPAERPTRVTLFRDAAELLLVTYLDPAVKHGRRGRVRQVRDEIRRQLRRLPPR